jgi:hypothetical protein
MTDWIDYNPAWDDEERDRQPQATAPQPVAPQAPQAGTNWIDYNPEWDNAASSFTRTGDPTQDTLRARTLGDEAIGIGREMTQGLGYAAGALTAPWATAAGGPVAGMFAAPAAAGAVNAAGQGLLDIAERKMLESRGIRPDHPAPTWQQELGQAGRDVKSGAETYLATEVMQKPAEAAMRGLLAPHSKQMTPERGAAIRTIEEMGIRPTPGMRTGSTFWSGIERMARTLLGSTRPAMENVESMFRHLVGRRNALLEMGDTQGEVALLDKKLKEIADVMIANQKGWNEAQKAEVRDEFLRRWGSGERVEVAAQRFLKRAEDRSNVLNTLKNRAYSLLDELVPSTNAQGESIQNELPNFIDTVNRMTAEEEKLLLPDEGLLTVMRKIASRGAPPEPAVTLADGTRLYRVAEGQGISIPGYPNQVLSINPPVGAEGTSFSQLLKLKARLNDLIRAENPAIQSGAPGVKGSMTDKGRVLSRLKMALDDELRDVARRANGEEAIGAMDAAEFLHGTVKERYENPMTLELLGGGKNPRYLKGFAKQVFTNLESKRLAEEVAGKPVVQRLQRAYVRALVEDSTAQSGTKAFDPAKMIELLSGIDEESRRAMFGREGNDAIMNALQGIADLDKIPKEFWSEVPRSETTKWLLNPTKPSRVRSFLPSLSEEVRDGVRGQMLLEVLGGEGNEMSAKAMGNLAKDMTTGRIPTNTRQFDSLGKMLFREGDWAQIKEFSNAIKLIGEYNKAGWNPGSGVPILQYKEFGDFLLNPFRQGYHWVAQNLAMRAYYSEWLADIVTRRLATPEQATRWGRILGKYLVVEPAAAKTGLAIRKIQNAGGDPLEETIKGIGQWKQGKPLKPAETVPAGPKPKTPAPTPTPGLSPASEAIAPQQTLDDVYGGSGGYGGGQDRVMTQQDLEDWFRQRAAEEGYE